MHNEDDENQPPKAAPVDREALNAFIAHAWKVGRRFAEGYGLTDTFIKCDYLVLPDGAIPEDGGEVNFYGENWNGWASQRYEVPMPASFLFIDSWDLDQALGEVLEARLLREAEAMRMAEEEEAMHLETERQNRLNLLRRLAQEFPEEARQFGEEQVEKNERNMP